MIAMIRKSTPAKLSDPRATATGDTGKTARSKPRPPGRDAKVKETGGPKGPEPTRYGDWERDGRCVDF